MGRTSTVEYRSSRFRPEYGKDGGRSEMCATRPRTPEPVNTIPGQFGRAGLDRSTKPCVNLAIQNTVREREDHGHDAPPRRKWNCARIGVHGRGACGVGLGECLGYGSHCFI